uniref:GAF domain-containing protein n=1 Tax=Zavarzinella formosa TaxID=360055 RepID=UPI0005927548
PFHITDALNDDRVIGHPSREAVQAYCGVPLMDKEGKIFGTLCHFDFKPMPVPDGHVELMEAVAPLIEKYDKVTYTPRRKAL